MGLFGKKKKSATVVTNVFARPQSDKNKGKPEPKKTASTGTKYKGEKESYDGAKKAFAKKAGEEMELYVHIPFCLRKCLYCDFLSFDNIDELTKRQYVDALKQEIALMSADTAALRKDSHAKVRSIYFGGGTPTSIPAEWLCEILEECRKAFDVKEDAEITLEANPGTLTMEGLRMYRQAGFNRLSLGVQCTSEELLKVLGRIHTFAQAQDSFSMARQAGFDNINVDLISALPNQTIEDWRETIRKVLLWKPEHISAYSLIVEPGTAFEKMYGEGCPGESRLPDEETDRQMYYDTERLLEEAGYHRYEISNYAKEGYECIHNLGYWQGVDYLGLGLGASTLWDRTRYQNLTDLSQYIDKAGSSNPDNLHKDVVKLGRKECMEEHMFLGLRCTEGISKHAFEEKFGVVYETVLGPATSRLLKKGLIEIVDDDMIRLTKLGLDVSNQVFAEFLLDD